jgi:hypothetical protein
VTLISQYAVGRRVIRNVLLLLKDLDYPSTQSIPADMYHSALVRAFLHEEIRLALADFVKTGAKKRSNE